MSLIRLRLLPKAKGMREGSLSLQYLSTLLVKEARSRASLSYLAW